jgi:hypothetical protein
LRWRLGLALLVPFLLASMLVGTATGAGAIEFLDQQGNRLSVDTTSQTFHYSSGFGRLSGVNPLIKPNRRFTFMSVGPDVTLIASVDLPSQRVNATLVDSRTHRWLTSMRNAGTSVPMTPTGTPTPALDAYRVVGDGLLVNNSDRSFKLDVFKNARQPLRGKFEYHDSAAHLHFVARRIDRFEVSGGQAKIEGVGVLQARGESKFQITVVEVGARGLPTVTIKLSGYNYFVQDEVRDGRVKVDGTASDPPSPTPTRTPTRLPTYTPTRTPTPLPTNTPAPSATPTRAITL